jgi:hypothetical protein
MCFAFERHYVNELCEKNERKMGAELLLLFDPLGSLSGAIPDR